MSKVELEANIDGKGTNKVLQPQHTIQKGKENSNVVDNPQNRNENGQNIKSKNLSESELNMAAINDILDSMNLKPELLRGIKEYGCEQFIASMNPAILKPENGHLLLPYHLAVIDKIISFCVPILQQIDFSVNEFQAIILLPTPYFKHLTSEVLRWLSKYMRLNKNQKTLPCFCDVSRNFTRNLKKKKTLPKPLPPIMIGVPEFIYDILNGNICNINLDHVKICVFNEPNEASVRQRSFQFKVLAYIPRNIRIFATSNDNMKSIKDDLENTVQIVRKIDFVDLSGESTLGKNEGNYRKRKLLFIKKEENIENNGTSHSQSLAPSIPVKKIKIECSS